MNYQWVKKITIISILLVAMTPVAWAQGLQAQVNSTKVAMGDSFQLTLSTEDAAAVAPDLNPLSKDFHVLGTSQSSQTSIVNGRRSSKKSWIVTLSPLKKGDINIPVIEAGALSSKAISVTVVDASEMPKSTGATGISVTATLEPGNHFIYQEIPLTVRIETQHNLQQAALVAPQGSDFELTQVGDDQSSQVVRNGQVVQVIERQYQLRAQSSGDIAIPPFVLEGTVVDPNGGSDPFAGMGFNRSMMRDFGFGNMFAQGAPFKVRTETLNLSVVGKPSDNQESWFLPAKQVKLKAEWTQPNPEFKVGEAVTRRISLLALGAKPEQLPELDLGQPIGAKFYIDDKATDEVQSAEGTVARRDILVSVVPTTGGDVVLPEVRVQWHDTLSNQQRTAVLPAETINVVGSVVEPATVAATTASSPVDSAENEPTDTIAAQDGATPSYSREIKFGMGALLLCGIAVYFLRRRSQAQGKGSVNGGKLSVRPTKADSPGSVPIEKRGDSALAQLRKQLIKGDARKIYNALLVWRREQPQSSAELESEILLLEQNVFAAELEQHNKEQQQWDSRNLKRILEEVVGKNSEPPRRGSVLPPLYPNQKPLMN